MSDEKSYDLTKDDQIEELTNAMANLEVGDTFKVGIKHNGSIGFGYFPVVVQDGDYLEISEPVMKY